MKPFRTRLLVATLVALLLALGATPAAADPGDDNSSGRPVPTQPASFPGDPGVPTFDGFPADPGVPTFDGFPGDPGVPSFESFPGDPGEPALQ